MEMAGPIVKLTCSKEISVTTIFGSKKEIVAVQPNRFNISWSMFASLHPDSDADQLAIDQNISYQKIHHFLSYYVDNSLWYAPESMECMDNHFSSTDNALMVTPNTNISILSNSLFAKFNSISKPDIHISDLKIYDFATNMSYDYNDEEYIIPAALPQQKDFMGELSVYEQPWWERDDVSTYDNKALDEKELHDVRMKLLEAEDLLERDFRTIEEEVKAHLSTPEFAELSDEEKLKTAELIKLDDIRKKKKKAWKPKLV